MGTVVGCSSSDKTDRYGDISLYDIMPLDDVDDPAEKLIIPEQDIVSEKEYLFFKDNERDRSRWRGVLNFVDKGEETDLYAKHKGWYCVQTGQDIRWFNVLSFAMMAYDTYISETEPISMARRDDFNFPDSVSCRLLD